MTDHDKLYIGGEWTAPATKDRIETAIWVLSGSGRWAIDPQTYRITLVAPGGERLRLQSIDVRQIELNRPKGGILTIANGVPN